MRRRRIHLAEGRFSLTGRGRYTPHFIDTVELPCPCTQCADSVNARDHQNAFIISAPHHHNAMGLEEALKECDTFVSEDNIPWSKIAEKHSVVRSTLTRKWRGETRSRDEQAVAQQKLTPQQEAELVKYIEELTARRIPPTREMIRNFASAVAQKPVSESWVTRFINRHAIHLISQYSTGMDADRHNADSFVEYKLYFDSLQAKIAEYDVEVENTYNMDETGVALGVCTNTRVLAKVSKKKADIKSLETREWVLIIEYILAIG